MREGDRADARPGSVTGGDRLRVLLATEHDPLAPTGLGQWATSLVDGLPEVEFVLWRLTPGRPGEQRRELPANVARVVEVSLASMDPFGPRRPLLPGIRPA